MNRFKETLDDLRKRSDAQDLAKMLPDLPGNGSSMPAGDDEPEFKLPYSSDPTPISEPWK